MGLSVTANNSRAAGRDTPGHDWLLLAVMLGQTYGEAIAIVAVIVAVAAWREHWAGRKF